MRSALVFEASRTGYGIEGVRKPMTVGELIEILQDWDDNTLVIMSHDNGYTYGSINTPELYTENENGEWERDW